MELQDILDEAMPEISRRFENELVTTSPVDKGLLRASIRVIPQGEGLLISMNETGKWVEFGTPPHVIRPKNRQALRFKYNNEIVFAKVVHHPGTRPNPFVRTAINTKLRKIIMEELERAR